MSQFAGQSEATPHRQAIPTVTPSPNREKDKRLSTARVRELIGASRQMTDAEVETLSYQMYALADIVTSEIVQRKGKREVRGTAISVMPDSVQ
jgi:hypothetical protein